MLVWCMWLSEVGPSECHVDVSIAIRPKSRLMVHHCFSVTANSTRILVSPHKRAGCLSACLLLHDATLCVCYVSLAVPIECIMDVVNVDVLTVPCSGDIKFYTVDKLIWEKLKEQYRLFRPCDGEVLRARLPRHGAFRSELTEISGVIEANTSAAERIVYASSASAEAAINRPAAVPTAVVRTPVSRAPGKRVAARFVIRTSERAVSVT